MDRRLGRFALSRYLLEDCPDVFKEILGTCIVVRCEQMFVNDTFEYDAICEDFEEVPVLVSAPWYEPEIANVSEPDRTYSIFKGWKKK